MKCNCKQELETKLTDRFKSATPKAADHKVKLIGFGIVLGGDNGCTERGYMEYETYALTPLAKGGSKPKKTTGNMFFSFCPFCGVAA